MNVTKFSVGIRDQLIKWYKWAFMEQSDSCCRSGQSTWQFFHVYSTYQRQLQILTVGRKAYSTSFLSLFHPCSTPTLERCQICNTLKRNNRGFKNAHCRCSTPYFLASQRLALVGVKQASFRDDISLSLFFGKNKSKTKLINFAVLVFVINKAVPSFCSRQNFILSNSHHTFLTNSRIGL